MSLELEEFDLRGFEETEGERMGVEGEKEGGFDQISISNWPGKGEKREKEREREKVNLVRVYEIFVRSYLTRTRLSWEDSTPCASFQPSYTL